MGQQFPGMCPLQRATATAGAGGTTPLSPILCVSEGPRIHQDSKDSPARGKIIRDVREEVLSLPYYVRTCRGNSLLWARCLVSSPLSPSSSSCVFMPAPHFACERMHYVRTHEPGGEIIRATPSFPFFLSLSLQSLSFVRSSSLLLLQDK